MSQPCSLDALRRQLAALPTVGSVRPDVGFGLGLTRVDKAIGSLAHGTMHDVHAATVADAVAAHGFTLGLVLRAARGPVVWITQTRSRYETGLIYGPGLWAWGLAPGRLILTTVKSTAHLLAAGEEALASGASGAVILSGWGEARDVTLTASRRLVTAARRGGATGFFVRAAALPAPSAAQTRWLVAAAPSTPLQAGAPGHPTFRAAQTRSRSGVRPGEWVLEWDRDRLSFAEPATSGGVVSLPADRPIDAHAA